MHLIKMKAFYNFEHSFFSFCYCKESKFRTIIIMFGKLWEDARIIEEQFTINDAHIRQVVTKDYQIDWPLQCVFGWYEEFFWDTYECTRACHKLLKPDNFLCFNIFTFQIPRMTSLHYNLQLPHNIILKPWEPWIGKLWMISITNKKIMKAYNQKNVLCNFSTLFAFPICSSS